MNLITYNEAYSLFPTPTFERQETLVISSNVTEGFTKAMAKYEARGWQVKRTLRRSEYNDYLVDRYHRVSDSTCWTVKLDITGVKLRTLLSTESKLFEWDPIVENNWRLVYNKVPKIKYRNYLSPITRYAYAIAHGEHGAAFDDFYVEHGFLEELYAKERALTGESGMVRIW